MPEVEKENKKKMVWIILPLVIIGLLVILFLVRDITGFTIFPVCRDIVVPFSYSVIDSKFDGGWCISCTVNWEHVEGFYKTGEVTVSNAEDIGAAFRVEYYFKTVDRTITKIKTMTLDPHETETFKFAFDSMMGQDVRGSYSVFPPVKPVKKCD